MKLFVFLSVCCISYLKVKAQPTSRPIEPSMYVLETTMIAIECARTLDPKELHIPKFGNTQQYPENDQTLREHLSCVWKKKGILNDIGEVDVKKLEDYLASQSYSLGRKFPLSQEVLLKIHEIVENCKDIKDDDYQLKAVKIQNCIISKNGYRLNLPLL